MTEHARKATGNNLPVGTDPSPPSAAAADQLADVTAADIVTVLVAALEQRDAAIEGLTTLLSEMRADHAVLAARVDVLDPPDMRALPGFVTLKEAAFASTFSDETIRRWAESGQVTSTKTGGRVLVELASVLERARRG